MEMTKQEQAITAAVAVPERFWSKVDKNGPVPEARPDLGACWLWNAYRRPAGYGIFKWAGTCVSAHRFAYEAFVGAIPTGLVLDHLCRQRSCVNPSHVEPVTQLENIKRGDQFGKGKVYRSKTHCPKGHPYSPENTFICRLRPKNGRQTPGFGRACRACARLYQAGLRQKRKERA